MKKTKNMEKNKSIMYIKDIDIEFNKLNDRLTIENIEYIGYHKALIFGNTIEVEKSDLTSSDYDLFIYNIYDEEDHYIAHITAKNIQFNNKDVYIE